MQSITDDKRVKFAVDVIIILCLFVYLSAIVCVMQCSSLVIGRIVGSYFKSADVILSLTVCLVRISRKYNLLIDNTKVLASDGIAHSE